MAESPEALARFTKLDKRLVAAVKSIRWLDMVSWPAALQTKFLAQWKCGKAVLPQVEYTRPDLSAVREALEDIFHAADPQHPIGDYLRRTVQSWRTVTELLEAVGTPRITEYSSQLFGRPGDKIPGGGLTNLDAARHFMNLADELDREVVAGDGDHIIPADVLRDDLQQQLDTFFVRHKVSVQIDPDLIPKAAAGPTTIRLRTTAQFSAYDRQQLLEHEAFVHSLTALNGREQPYLRSLERSSPRVTATQEGLAVFAELMSGAIDITRMKRISLRILAIDKALNGADFIDVFRFFLEAGQIEAESFTSAMRVFRGSPVTGGTAFTKDTVYLHGLLSVYTFFHWALKNRRFKLCHNLFAGKMTLQDVIALEPWFESGYIAQPLYLPPWAMRANGLAGMLAFSLFANKMHLDQVQAEDLMLGV